MENQKKSYYEVVPQFKRFISENGETDGNGSRGSPFSSIGSALESIKEEGNYTFYIDGEVTEKIDWPLTNKAKVKCKITLRGKNLSGDKIVIEKTSDYSGRPALVLDIATDPSDGSQNGCEECTLENITIESPEVLVASIGQGCTLNFKSGVITTGDNTKAQTLVKVNGGTFNMSGGTISQVANSNDSSVTAFGVDVVSGNFVMTGGAITDNFANGLHIGNTATAHIKGGAIKNTKDNSGVFVEGTLYLEGGEISNNGGDSSAGGGINASANTSKVIMTGGVIKNNVASLKFLEMNALIQNHLLREVSKLVIASLQTNRIYTVVMCLQVEQKLTHK